MTITGNPESQLELAQSRADIAEAESLALRAALATSVDETERARRWAIALEQHNAHTVALVNELTENDYLHDFGDLLTELSDHVNGMVKGQ